MSYTKPGLKYWIVSFVCQKKREDGSFATLYETVPVQGPELKGPSSFRPGDILQLIARNLNGAAGRDQDWSYSLLSVQETTRHDLESYCADFDKGRYLIEYDREVCGSRLIQSSFD